MPKTKQRLHREWFRPVLRGNRKSCPSCGEKLRGEQIWCHGEYVNAKWRNVEDFCRRCWDGVRAKLLAHAGPCGCQFELVGYHTGLPWWLSLKPRTVPTTVTEIELKT